MLPPLVDLLQILGAGGAIVGAVIGFALRPRSDAELVTNIVNGAALGGIAGSMVAFAIWIGGTAAGG